MISTVRRVWYGLPCLLRQLAVAPGKEAKGVPVLTLHAYRVPANVSLPSIVAVRIRPARQGKDACLEGEAQSIKRALSEARDRLDTSSQERRVLHLCCSARIVILWGQYVACTDRV